MHNDVHAQLKVPHCFRCEGNVEFYCKTCREDLCVLCKEKHMIDLDTRYHDVVIHRLKYDDSMIQEYCERHGDLFVEYWCMSCEFPVCVKCDEHQNHAIVNIVSAYKMCRDRQKDRIAHIRTNTILKNLAILKKIKYDIKMGKEICQSILSGLHQGMTIKTLRLKDLVVNNVNELKHFKRLLKFRLKEPKRKIINTEICLYNLEKVLDKPVLFIMCLKKTPIPRVRGIPDTFLLSLNRTINRKDVIMLLGEIQVTEAKNRQVRNKQLLGLMHKPVLQKSLSMIGTIVVRHISFFTRDIIWLSDQYGRIILTNTTGASLHIVPNTMSYTGGHCVTNDGDLIYIDRYHNINRLYKDKITQYTVRKIREPWMAECVYYSPSSADLLVGMVEYDKDNHIYTDAKVMRFDFSGISCHIIEHNKKGQKLYKFPKYITENHNGDVIVSDLNHGVVVTSRTGRHRFSYTGPSSWTGIYPQGVCVDALSHILVCDAKSKTIQMIDKNGSFLSLLFTEENEITVSGGLAYDIKNHLLYVGATDRSSTVCVYRYIQRKNYLTDDFNH